MIHLYECRMWMTSKHPCWVKRPDKKRLSKSLEHGSKWLIMESSSFSKWNDSCVQEISGLMAVILWEYICIYVYTHQYLMHCFICSDLMSVTLEYNFNKTENDKNNQKNLTVLATCKCDRRILLRIYTVSCNCAKNSNKQSKNLAENSDFFSEYMWLVNKRLNSRQGQAN